MTEGLGWHSVEGLVHGLMTVFGSDNLVFDAQQMMCRGVALNRKLWCVSVLQ